MQRERRQRSDAAPITLRSPGLAKVARSSSPEKLRELLAAALIRIELAIAELDAHEGSIRYGT